MGPISVLLLLILQYGYTQGTGNDPSAPGEYCYTFSASCPAGEVVWMQAARYGRMRLGWCVTVNHHLGCYADILQFVDQRCSGRHNCSFPIDDPALEKFRPCPKGYRSYLEANFTCVTVSNYDAQRCQGSEESQHLTAPGYLGSVTASQEEAAFTNACPWQISVQPGQKIRLTLYDFNTSRPDSSDRGGPPLCYVHARIKENGRNLVVCRGSERERTVYQSQGHTIEVKVMTVTNETQRGHFLLKYEAVGCPDMPTPKGSSMKRLGDNLTITCNSTRETYYLTCNGTQWMGEFMNCSQGTDPSPSPPPLMEFCHLETFRASCPAGEVVLMQEARYGRMRLGRCVTTGYYVGCSADILSYAHHRCSGRTDCHFPIGDLSSLVEPCAEDLMKYLEASYVCVKVSNSDTQRCQDDEESRHLTAPGYLGSVTASQEEAAFTNACPWQISAQPGQRIKLTLNDFKRADRSDEEGRPPACYVLAIIKENGRRVVVCRESQGERTVYHSEGPTVEVQVMTKTNETQHGHFLLKYEAVGCPDMPAPKGGWMRRQGDQLTIMCNNTRETHYLTCKGTQWIGEFMNCSQDSGTLTLTISPSEVSLQRWEGTSLEVECSVGGVPEGDVVDVAWYANGRRIDSGYSRVIELSPTNHSRRLYVFDVMREDAGNYTCQAAKDGHTVSHTVNLNVLKDITFDNARLTQYVWSGTDALIQCEASGNPVPTVWWHKHGEVIKSGGRYQYEAGGLRVYKTTRADTGLYTCVAEVAAEGRVKETLIKVIVR